MTLDPQGRWHYIAVLSRDGDENVVYVDFPNRSRIRIPLEQIGPEITDQSIQDRVRDELSLAFQTEFTDQFIVRVDRSQYPTEGTAS